MEETTAINYIDGGVTTIDLHSTKPILYYNKLNHVYEHDYKLNKRKLLHSFINPIKNVFHVPGKNHEVIIMDNQLPPAITLLDTQSCTIKSVTWSKLKNKPLQSFLIYNSEHGTVVLIHKIGKTDVLVEVVQIRDGILFPINTQIFNGLVDLKGSELLSMDKTTTNIIIYGDSSVIIVTADNKKGTLNLKIKFSIEKQIKKIRANPLLQIFAIMDSQHSLSFYDVDGLLFNKIDSKQAVFLDFTLLDNSLRTLCDDGGINTANLTKLTLKEYSRIDFDSMQVSSLLIHKNMDHLIIIDKFKMLKVFDYKANRIIVNLILNDEKWISSTIFNKNLYMFNRYNMNGVYKQVGDQRCVEYYMLEGFDEKITCSVQHNEFIIIGSEAGKINVYDPINMNVKQTIKVSDSPIRSICSVDNRSNHILIRTNDQIVLLETHKILKILKTIDRVDEIAPLALDFTLNKGFGNYGITSYTASYCVTSTFLRIIEINITDQFIDYNPLFEFEFNEEIIDFKFDAHRKTALILHETNVTKLNKNTGIQTEVAWFESRALSLSVDTDFGLFAVLLEDNKLRRTYIEIYRPKNTNAINRIEFNYLISKVEFLNSDLLILSENGLLEARPKLSVLEDDRTFFNKFDDTTINSEYHTTKYDKRSLPLGEVSIRKPLYSKTKITNRNASIKEASHVNITEHIRSKYLRCTQKSTENKENLESVSKPSGNEKEHSSKIDYTENLKRLANTYNRKNKLENTVTCQDILIDPQDIDD